MATAAAEAGQARIAARHTRAGGRRRLPLRATLRPGRGPRCTQRASGAATGEQRRAYGQRCVHAAADPLAARPPWPTRAYDAAPSLARPQSWRRRPVARRPRQARRVERLASTATWEELAPQRLACAWSLLRRAPSRCPSRAPARRRAAAARPPCASPSTRRPDTCSERTRSAQADPLAERHPAC